MEIEGWSPTLSAGPLLLIAAGAIALLLVLIMKLRLHAFPALVLISFLTALITIPTESIVDVLLYGFGNTLASVALLVGLGAMLGAMLEVSGGAQVLAHQLIKVFGENRAPFALGVASLLFGFPIFFDAGLVVMLPVVFSVARWVGGSMLLYGLPAVGAFSVMHVLLPPHPGPVTAATQLGGNVGMVLLVGLVVALPTWYLAVYLFSKVAGRRITLPVPNIFGDQEVRTPKVLPTWGTVTALLLLPMVLIFCNTGLSTLAKSGAISESVTSDLWYKILVVLGQTPVALLLTLLVAMVVLGGRRSGADSPVHDVLEGALPPVCSVILITGAGGMFGGVLRTSGIGGALADALEGLGIPLIFAGFLIAAILRVAQGSATVALTTASGLIAPGVAAAGFNEVQLASMVIAIAAGSVVLSHFNDSGFWLVGRFFQMDEKTTLKTWTVMETLIGVMAFGLAAVIFYLGAAIG